jgi:hypothetical protein
MFLPPFRIRLILLHLGVSLALLLAAGSCLYRLAAFPPDIWGAVTLTGLVIALFTLPAFVYRLVVLFRARYGILPTGALRIAFGSRVEILPLDEVEEIRTGTGIPAALKSAAPGWGKTWQGRTKTEDGRPVDWFATDHGERLLLIVTRNRLLAVSPANPFLFVQTVTDYSAQGSLEKSHSVSLSPPPIIGDILADRTAFGILIAGVVSLTGLGACLIGLQPGLPANQFFKFEPSGAPTGEGDPARLLLLPLIGACIWLMNAMVGWAAWRKNDRYAAYILWIASLLISVGLWFASGLLVYTR